MYYKVTFVPARNGGVMARVVGKVAFPARFWSPPPKEGEEWIVEIAGENPRGTVYFLRPVKRWEGTKEDARLCGWEEYRDLSRGVVSFKNPSDPMERIELPATEEQWWQDYCYLRSHPNHLLLRRDEEGKMVGTGWLREGEEPLTTDLEWWAWNHPDHVPVGPQPLVEEFRKLAAEFTKRKEEEQARLEERRRKFFEQKIKPLLTGAELEERVVEATHYRVEILEDCDWGLHKADPGYSIRVTPLYEGAVPNPFRHVEEEVAQKLFGISWLDLEEGAEDGIPEYQEAFKLVKDWVASRYVRLDVRLTPDQVKEIDEKYPDRDGRDPSGEGKDFSHRATWWLPKEAASLPNDPTGAAGPGGGRHQPVAGGRTPASQAGVPQAPAKVAGMSA